MAITKILDRYIVKKFLSTFIFVVLVLVSVLMVIDYTEKSESFIKNKPGIYKILVEYYLNFFPYWANLLSPITVFIATVFVTSKMASRTEIIAILSSGVSFRRFLVPYLAGSIMIGGVIFYLQGWVVPDANKVRIAFEVKYDKSPFYYDKRNVHIKVGPNQYAYLESYNNTINAGYQFTLETIKGQGLDSKLKAEKITWLPEKQKWVLDNYSLRQFVNEKETLKFGQRLDTTLNLLPKDFESKYMFYETLNSTELGKFIKDALDRGTENVEPYLVEKYLRITSPFAIIILTMIGVILSARKSRGGTGFQIALGFVLAFIYIMFFIMSRSIANAGNINPLLACWLPNIVFSILGLILYNTVPR